MIGDIFRIIFNLVLLPILSGLFLGASLYVFLSFKKQYEIKDVGYIYIKVQNAPRFLNIA